MLFQCIYLVSRCRYTSQPWGESGPCLSCVLFICDISFVWELNLQHFMEQTLTPKNKKWHPWPPSHHLRFLLHLLLPLLLLFLRPSQPAVWPESTPGADTGFATSTGSGSPKSAWRAVRVCGAALWMRTVSSALTWALWMSSLGKNRVTGQTGPAASGAVYGAAGLHKRRVQTK